MKDFKDVIESHPLRVMVAVVVSTATITSSAISWYWLREDKLTRIQHELDLQQVKHEVTEQVSDLKARLLSIERRVGDQKLYLDVTTIPISRSSVTSLPTTYRAFDNGTFYVDPPKFAIWQNSQMSQLDLAAMRFGNDFAQYAKQMFGAALSKPLTTWIFNSRIDVKSSEMLRKYGIERIHLFPTISVMNIDKEYLQTLRKEVARYSIDIQSTIQELLALKEQMKATENRTTSDVVTSSIDGEAYEQIAELSESERKRARADQEEKLADQLAGLFSGDLAGFVLTDTLMRGTQLANIIEGKYRVVDANKKGNILYMRAQTELKSDMAMDRDKAVFLDQEYFFIAMGESGILVTIEVPSFDLRGPAYAWTQAWLTSLRIPLD